MGLAGRKQKQRIPADPRNLSWADDASRFGLSYLSKFGWDASQGLGSSRDGMKTHLKVQQKLDMMGIGAQHRRDPNGIAWKQNKEFEALLKKLNENAGQGKGVDGEEAAGDGGRVREIVMDKAFVRAHEESAGEESVNESSIKKRKHKDGDDSGAIENTRKKQKKEKHRKSSSDDATAPSLDPISEPLSAPSSTGPHSEPIPKSRLMAHRTRIRAAKRIAGKSASAISEILGIAPSSSVSTSTVTSTPAPTTSSSESTPVPQPSLSLDNLTTSTKSVADYFKEKLLARSSSSSSPVSSSAPSGSATPGLGTAKLRSGLSDVSPPDEDELLRRGIGSRAAAVLPPSQGPESGSGSGGGDDNADGRDMLTEKQRRKAECKDEKRKRREAEASQVAPEGVATVVKAQTKEDDAEKVQRTSEEKKRRERKQQAPTDNDDAITMKKRAHDDPSGSLPEPNKKSKKEHKKKRS